MTDRLELVIPGKPEYLRHIRSWCEALMKQRGFAQRAIQEFLLALTEACANTIEHCLKQDPDKHLHLECSLGTSRFEVSIVNYCHPEDLPNIKPRKLSDVRPGGLGTHFIRQTSDQITYAPNGEGGIRLTLTKIRHRSGKTRRPTSKAGKGATGKRRPRA